MMHGMQATVVNWEPVVSFPKRVGQPPCGFPNSVNLLGAVCALVELCKEASDFLALKSPVTPGCNAVCPYSSFVTPTPQGVRIDIEELGYFPHRQHVIHVFIICHVFSYHSLINLS